MTEITIPQISTIAILLWLGLYFLVLILINIFMPWIKVWLTGKQTNSEYLPVGTIVLAKLEFGKHSEQRYYIVENDKVTASNVAKKLMDAEGVTDVVSYEYITPPKP